MANSAFTPTGTAAVNTVSNSDSTLTITPTSGAVVASINLGHANTWTAAQTLNGGILDGNSQSQAYRPINNQTGTTYTLVLGDGGQMVTLNNAGAITLTIPANASVAFPVGTEIDLLQLGAGQVTVAITSDTLNSYTSKTKLAGQYAGGTLKKILSTTWVLVGNLA